MASGCSSRAHSPVKRFRIVVMLGIIGCLLYDGDFDTHTYRRCLEDPNIRAIPGNRSKVLPNFMLFA